MTSKIEHPPQMIDRESFSRSQVLTTASIHLTGGIRADQVNGGWSIQPVPSPDGPKMFRPFQRTVVDHFATTANLRIIGTDQISGIGGPLPARIWTPQYGQNASAMSAADQWGAIAIAASRSNDDATADSARKIEVTLNAAGIRIRDASDCLHAQLHAAIIEERKPGQRFKNIPLLDLFLAFHSLMSEMASARDYIAQFAARKLGAPKKIDSLNFFEGWAVGSTGATTDPLAAALLGSREAGADNAWLAELTEYRNIFLHRMPIAAMKNVSLVIVERQVEQIAMRFVEMHIPDLVSGSGTCDALPKFVGLHQNLLNLAAFAADHTGYSTAPPAFVVSPGNDTAALSSRTTD